MAELNRLSRFQGCLLGGAVGDALAKPAQFRDPDDLAARYGRITEFGRSDDYLYWLLPEQWSDDTFLVLIFAESIAAQGWLDMADVSQRLVAWRRGGDVRGIDMDVDNAIQMLAGGWDWQQTGREGERAGRNNPTVRATPLGLLHSSSLLTDPAALREDAHSSTIFSHNHPEAVAGATAVAYAVARLAAGLPPAELTRLLPETAAFIGVGKVAATLGVVAELLAHNTPPSAALAEIGTGGYAWQAVGTAFYCFLHDPSDFEATVVNAVMGGNDADTNASIAASLSGAHNGLAAIPARWQHEIDEGEKLLRVAGLLAALGGS